MVASLIIADMIIGICLWILFGAIIINFMNSRQSSSSAVKKKKKSIVETGTMLLFFFGFYLLVRFNIGLIRISSDDLNLALIVIGTLMIIAGCIFNVMGRFNLGHNWGHQVIIYKDHSLVETGLYGIVRHPLYASIMLMFYGACLVHTNTYAFLATTFIFIPFMYYRAKQEEVELSKVFKEYAQYKSKVGMFFPKLIK